MEETTLVIYSMEELYKLFCTGVSVGIVITVVPFIIGELLNFAMNLLKGG